MSDVFLSYSKKDRSIVEDVSAKLYERGVTTWWDTHLEVGNIFKNEIEERISNAKAVLVLWTDNSIQSEWVNYEADLALRNNKYVPAKSTEINFALIAEKFKPIHTETLTEFQKIEKRLHELSVIFRAPRGVHNNGANSDSLDYQGFDLWNKSKDDLLSEEKYERRKAQKRKDWDSVGRKAKWGAEYLLVARDWLRLKQLINNLDVYADAARDDAFDRGMPDDWLDRREDLLLLTVVDLISDPLREIAETTESDEEKKKIRRVVYEFCNSIIDDKRRERFERNWSEYLTL